MIDERVMQRWLRLEAGNLNAGLVRTPRKLTELLREATPQLPTKSDGTYHFDLEVLQGLASRLSPIVRMDLRLPIFVYIGHETPGDCHLADAAAIKAVQQLGLVDRDAREGKLWMSTGLARTMARQWPAVFQFVRL